MLRAGGSIKPIIFPDGILHMVASAEPTHPYTNQSIVPRNQYIHMNVTLVLPQKQTR